MYINTYNSNILNINSSITGHLNKSRIKMYISPDIYCGLIAITAVGLNVISVFTMLYIKEKIIQRYYRVSNQQIIK